MQAAAMSHAEILADFPELTEEDSELPRRKVKCDRLSTKSATARQ